MTGGSDGVRAADGLSGAGGCDAVGFGGALADNGGRDSVGFGGALADNGGRDSVGFGATLADNGGRDGVGFGATLADSGGRDSVGFGGALADNGGRDSVGFGATLADNGGRDGVGFARLSLSAVDFRKALSGAGVLVAAITGTLADSGMSSQPASMSSSGGLAASSVPCDPPRAPEAISVRVPEPAADVAASTVHFSVAMHTGIYEPRQGTLGTTAPEPHK